MNEDNAKVEVARLLLEVSRIAKQYIHKSFEKENLTAPQGAVLGILAKHGKIKISELSEKMYLSNSTVSGILDRLEKQGLVLRERSAEDRRTVYVAVTNKFEEVHRGMHEKLEEKINDLFSTGTPEQTQKIYEGLLTLKQLIISKID